MEGPGKGVGAEEERGTLQAKPAGKGVLRGSPASPPLPLQLSICGLSLGRLDSTVRSEVRLQLQPTLFCP